MLFSRRASIAALSAFALAKPAVAAQPDLSALEKKHGGRLGVFALDTGSGRTLQHRADERFTMCSTFKGLLAAQVLHRIDNGKERLDRVIRYSEKDLIFTSPVTKANVEKGALSIAALCKAIVEVSDNTAAILLMREAGGPEGLTQFLRTLGDQVTRADRYEPDSNNYDGDLDTTSPRAITGTVRAILLGNILSARSRDTLEGWMIATMTGKARLRAAFPNNWIAGDKTGTSAARQTNDYALVRPPGRAPLVVAAYLDAPHLGLDAREAVLREVGAAFVRWAV